MTTLLFSKCNLDINRIIFYKYLATFVNRNGAMLSNIEKYKEDFSRLINLGRRMIQDLIISDMNENEIDEKTKKYNKMLKVVLILITRNGLRKPIKLFDKLYPTD